MSQMKGVGANTATSLAVFSVSAALFFPSMALGQVALGSTSDFAVLAGTTVSNSGATTVTGNVGIWPGDTISGFPPGNVLSGTTESNTLKAGQAQADLTTAFNAAAALPCSASIVADLGGQTLGPGVYCAASSAALNGTLTLDFQGNPHAVFVFRTVGSLTTGNTSRVVAINTGWNDCYTNVNWVVGSDATLAASSTFAGNILANQNVTLGSDARLSGRVLSRSGAVTMDRNTVTACTMAAAPSTGAAVPVPTLSQWAFALLSSLVTVSAWTRVRRRREGVS